MLSMEGEKLLPNPEFVGEMNRLPSVISDGPGKELIALCSKIGGYPHVQIFVYGDEASVEGPVMQGRQRQAISRVQPVRFLQTPRHYMACHEKGGD